MDLVMMKTKSDIRQDYFQWLCEKMHVDCGADSYWFLMRELHDIPFISIVDHDENRAYDGTSLRERYFAESSWMDNFDALDGPCSMLEMLVALSERISFELGDPDYGEPRPDRYFWEMMDNLELADLSDSKWDEMDGDFRTRCAIDILLNREYDEDGKGGLFPLKYNNGINQREIEIWYQMQGYLNERIPCNR